MKVRGYSGGAHGRAPLHAQSIPSLSRIGIRTKGGTGQHKWAVGHTTFEFSFSLPEPANSGIGSWTTGARLT